MTTHYRIPDGQGGYIVDIGPNTPFSLPDGRRFPANWAQVVGADDRAAIGMETYEVTESDEQIAHRTFLTKVQLWGELDDHLIDAGVISLGERSDVYMLGVIAASEALTAEQKARATAAIHRAETFQGSDPLLYTCGALIGLDTDTMHDLIIAASTRTSV